MTNNIPIDGEKLRAAIRAHKVTATRICTRANYCSTYLGQRIRRGSLPPEMVDILAEYDIAYAEYAPETEDQR